MATAQQEIPTTMKDAAVILGRSYKTLRKAIDELGIKTPRIPATGISRGISPADMKKLEAHFKAKYPNG